MKENKFWVVFFMLITIFSLLFLIGFKMYKNEKIKRKNEETLLKREQLVKEISEHYSSNVITVTDATIYVFDDNQYKEAGTISKDVKLKLDSVNIDYDTNYFKISNLGNQYYISYSDVKPSEEWTSDQRYLNYILFNKNIITKDITHFYIDDKLIYTINDSFNLPIYIIDDDKYYVEYDNQLMYIKNDDVNEIKDNNNSDQLKANNVITIAYHFIYDPDNGETCEQEICHTMNLVQSHMDYLKQNNYFTLKMKEFEMWIDGKLNIPKNSIMITVDDGWYAGNASKIFTDNEINATIFLISSSYDPEWVETKYVEAHSHTHNLHTQYQCPGYGKQGGGLLCLPEETILNDLKASREKLNMTTYLAYPFYDFNDYTISLLKKAGFTMGFGGYYEGGHYGMIVGGDKYRIPRVTLGYNTTVSDLSQILGR